MDKPADPHWTDEDFSMDAMVQRCRDGSFPPGYLDAYGARLHALSQAIRCQIEADIAEVDGAEGWTF